MSPEGRRQAKTAGARVRALLDDYETRVITSSMNRAIDTGAAIAGVLGVSPQIDPDWDEQNFGDWDNKKVSLLAERHPQEFLRFREDPHYARPGGEAHVDLQARVLAAFERAATAGGTVVVVSHRKRS